MKKILIATRNRDKFKLISKLMTNTFNEYAFESLRDIKVEIIDKQEVGDVINRAQEKAQNVFDNLPSNEYEYVVGIDDAIKIKGKVIENVKDYINDILFHNYLENGEIVYIVRAYSFIDSKGKKMSVLTEIPFSYQPLKHDFKIEENSYPLSHVLATIDQNSIVIDLSETESNDYYSKYSYNKLEEVKKFYHNNNNHNSCA